jgi:hypothetical protein
MFASLLQTSSIVVPAANKTLAAESNEIKINNFFPFFIAFSFFIL